jgi:hypothetical protein
VILYSDRSCPFALRVRAYALHHGIEIEDHVFPVGEKPAAVLQLSPQGRIPVLVDESLVLTESATMLEYLASEEIDAESRSERARRRNLFARVDALLVPRAIGTNIASDAPLRDDFFDELDLGRADARRQDGVLAFLVGSFWRLLKRRDPHDDWLTHLASDPARASLARWLENAAQMPALLARESTDSELWADFRAVARLAAATPDR